MSYKRRIIGFGFAGNLQKVDLRQKGGNSESGVTYENIRICRGESQIKCDPKYFMVNTRKNISHEAHSAACGRNQKMKPRLD
jgi:hypothetical protein